MNPINQFCPRSGKRVQPDSLTQYRGLNVGFCNSGCRDDFAQNAVNRPQDRSYFDTIIQEHGLEAKL